MGDGRPENWELGDPATYTITFDRHNIPLAASTIWPDDMRDREAAHFAKRVEQMGNQRLGLVDCIGGHEAWWLPDSGCPWCKAVL